MKNELNYSIKPEVVMSLPKVKYIPEKLQNAIFYRPKHSILKFLEYSLFFILLLDCMVGYALPTDKEQTMHVVADSANLSQKTHKGIYSGNVEFVQGTTNLHASKAMTQADAKNQLTLAIANGEKGKQAHYWTETGPDKPPFHAYADTIKYYPLKHIIELIGNARVEQGTNSLSAAKISYDTIEQHVITESNETTRTMIIIYPEKKPT